MAHSLVHRKLVGSNSLHRGFEASHQGGAGLGEWLRAGYLIKGSWEQQRWGAGWRACLFRGVWTEALRLGDVLSAKD